MAFLKFFVLFALVAVAAAHPTILDKGCSDGVSDWGDKIHGGADNAAEAIQNKGGSEFVGAAKKQVDVGAGFEKKLGGGVDGAGVAGAGASFVDAAQDVGRTFKDGAGVGIKTGLEVTDTFSSGWH